MPQSLAILVLNFNGRHLLEKNLPFVINAAQNSPAPCRVIVADNDSQDDSVQFLKKNFPSLTIIRFFKNYGFSEGNNLAIKKIKADIVVLLNTDVRPKADFLKHLIPHFQDRQVFAVAPLQILKTKGQKEGKSGWVAGLFRYGILKHDSAFALGKKPKGLGPLPTFYASGGAAAFDRQKFLDLGGFDPIFQPFYWEDADLSYQAWKQGFKVLFEPKSKVIHEHETTIKKYHSIFFIQMVGMRNMLLFNWLNLNDFSFWLKHIFWLPIHFLKYLFRGQFPQVIGMLWALIYIPEVIRKRTQRPKQRSDRAILNLTSKGFFNG